MVVRVREILEEGCRLGSELDAGKISIIHTPVEKPVVGIWWSGEGVGGNGGCLDACGRAGGESLETVDEILTTGRKRFLGELS